MLPRTFAPPRRTLPLPGPRYVRSLRFDDKPDYAYLRKLFRDLFVREGEWRRRRCCSAAAAAAAGRLRPAAAAVVRLQCDLAGATLGAACLRALQRPNPAALPASRPAGFTWDYVFDWTILKYAQQQNSRPSSSRPADGAYGGAAAQQREDARDAEAALRRLGLQ